MKKTLTMIALAALGFLGQSAFADCNCQPLGLAVVQNGHGQQRFEYFPQNGQSAADTSVALYTSSGGGIFAPLGGERPLTDNGETKLVLGTNQHGQATAAYIPVSSHYGPAGQ